MGRRKLPIVEIVDAKKRKTTFEKRKAGLVKKANELGILARCKILTIIISCSGELYQYCNVDISEILKEYMGIVEKKRKVDDDSLMLQDHIRVKEVDGEEISKMDLTGLMELEQKLTASIIRIGDTRARRHAEMVCEEKQKAHHSEKNIVGATPMPINSMAPPQSHGTSISG